MVTPAVEDYLKAIYRLQQDGSAAMTNAIAERLGLRAASVTAMLQQLSEQGLADYTPYRGAFLTETGTAAALRVIRRHRLIELYLHQHLDVPLERLHDEAERLEHSISLYLEEKIAAKLGNPSFDPHGDPIPSSTGELPSQDLISLYEAPLNVPATVRHIPDDNPDMLRYVVSLGIIPGVVVKVTRREPFDGPAYLSVISSEGGALTDHVVGEGIARSIYVTRSDV
jgi:DtxR family transcriptional regulator, Mn-dependent transcriptional regulator